MTRGLSKGAGVAGVGAATDGGAAGAGAGVIGTVGVEAGTGATGGEASVVGGTGAAAGGEVAGAGAGDAGAAGAKVGAGTAGATTGGGGASGAGVVGEASGAGEGGAEGAGAAGSAVRGRQHRGCRGGRGNSRRRWWPGLGKSGWGRASGGPRCGKTRRGSQAARRDSGGMWRSQSRRVANCSRGTCGRGETGRGSSLVRKSSSCREDEGPRREKGNVDSSKTTWREMMTRFEERSRQR
jgi:hypothetical protein